MNHKRFLLTLGALLLVATSAFAEIALKDLGDGNVDITFTFKDETAPEMGVIGSFNNWTQPGEMMTKNADGLWEKTIRASSSDAITYKFLTKGTWIFDEKAPDKKDDGYGGFNGLIPVADILSGLIPAVPGAPPVVAKGPKKAVNQRPRVTFGTETYLESDTSFDVSSGKFKAVDSTLNAKSLWKFDGDLAPGMPGHLEMTVFNGHPKVMDTGATKVKLSDGLQQAGAGFLLNPFYYLGDNKKPTLDKVRFGFDTPYLIYETGYANSVLPPHKSILWDTVSDSNKANDGYSFFGLGPKAKTWGDFTIDAAMVPNKSQDDFYGLYSFVSAEAYGIKAELQYEMKSSTKDEPGKMFTDVTRDNIALGAEAYLGEFLIQGQLLSSGGTALETFDASEKLAFKVSGGYKDVYGDTELLFGYAYRGGNWTDDGFSVVVTPTASLLYAANDDELGSVGTQTLSVNGLAKFGYWGIAKFEGSLVQSASGNPDTNSVVSAKPGFLLDLDKLSIMPLSIDWYAQLKYNTDPAAGTDAFVFASTGAKVAVPSLDVYWKFDNSNSDTLFNTVLAEANLGGDLKAQAGGGLRSGENADNAFGAVVGLSYVVPAPEAKTPTAYCQFVYNMDPYNAEGASTYDLSDFGPSNGVAGSDGVAALRVGLRWNY